MAAANGRTVRSHAEVFPRMSNGSPGRDRLWSQRAADKRDVRHFSAEVVIQTEPERKQNFPNHALVAIVVRGRTTQPQRRRWPQTKAGEGRTTAK